MNHKTRNNQFKKNSLNVILVFLLVLLTSFGNSQTIDCCDSLMKITKGTIKKTVYRKPIDKQNHDFIISIDNSNSANNYSNEKKDITDKSCNCSSRTIDPIDKPGVGWKDLWRNLPTILIALIAGFIALYQMKLNIISSARIRWIEDLRDSLSKLYPAAIDTVVSAENYRNAKASNNQTDFNQYYSEYSVHISNFNILSNKIKMQLNSNEAEHKYIEDLIDKIDFKLDTKNIENITAQDIENDLKLIVSYSKKIFKKEWDKSKRIFKI
jgi:hypothetical protein